MTDDTETTDVSTLTEYQIEMLIDAMVGELRTQPPDVAMYARILERNPSHRATLAAAGIGPVELAGNDVEDYRRRRDEIISLLGSLVRLRDRVALS